MIRRICLLVLTAVLFSLAAPPSRAQDMRDAARQRALQREKLARQMAAEHAAAQEKAAAQREKILQDRQRLTAAVDGLKDAVRALKDENRRLEARLDDLNQKESALDDALSNTDSVLQDLIGHARTGAKDLDALTARTPQGPLSVRAADSWRALSEDNRFPSMADLSGLVNRAVGAIRRSGEVQNVRQPFVDRKGRQVAGEVLFIGPFTAAYRVGGRNRFSHPYGEYRTAVCPVRTPPVRRRKQAGGLYGRQVRCGSPWTFPKAPPFASSPIVAIFGNRSPTAAPSSGPFSPSAPWPY